LDFENILFERDGAIGRITLNRPEVKNTFDLDTRAELLRLLDQVRDDDALKVLTLTGAGDAFSSGGDIRTMEGYDFTAVGGRMRVKRAHRVIKAMMDLEKPLIGAVNGVAAGAGVSAALACDILIASEKARFFLSFVRIGVVPDMGNFYLLPLRIGVPRAKELMLTGGSIGAREAERWGLVSKVVPHERLDEALLSLAARLAKGSGRSYGAIKAALNKWPADLKTFIPVEPGPEEGD